jgi:hypothetical protein
MIKLQEFPQQVCKANVNTAYRHHDMNVNHLILKQKWRPKRAAIHGEQVKNYALFSQLGKQRVHAVPSHALRGPNIVRRLV